MDLSNSKYLKISKNARKNYRYWSIATISPPGQVKHRPVPYKAPVWRNTPLGPSVQETPRGCSRPPSPPVWSWRQKRTAFNGKEVVLGQASKCLGYNCVISFMAQNVVGHIVLYIAYILLYSVIYIIVIFILLSYWYHIAIILISYCYITPHVAQCITRQ